MTDPVYGDAAGDLTDRTVFVNAHRFRQELRADFAEALRAADDSEFVALLNTKEAAVYRMCRAWVKRK